MEDKDEFEAALGVSINKVMDDAILVQNLLRVVSPGPRPGMLTIAFAMCAISIEGKKPEHSLEETLEGTLKVVRIVFNILSKVHEGKELEPTE